MWESRNTYFQRRWVLMDAARPHRRVASRGRRGDPPPGYPRCAGAPAGTGETRQLERAGRGGRGRGVKEGKFIYLTATPSASDASKKSPHRPKETPKRRQETPTKLQEAPEAPTEPTGDPRTAPKWLRILVLQTPENLPRDANEHSRGLEPTTQARWRDRPTPLGDFQDRPT